MSGSEMNRLILVKAQGTQNHDSCTGSQIIRICMEIYLKIDKMVKMYKNSYLSIHTS